MGRFRALPFVLVATLVVAPLRISGGLTSASAIDCGDYPNQQFAQFFLKVMPDDPNDLDGPNDNGIACEDLPCPCDTEPVPEAVDDRSAPPSPMPATMTIGGDGASVTFSGSAGVSASASLADATDIPIAAPPTTTPESAATGAPAPGPSASNVITPPSTGTAGLLP